jgi:heat shock protein HtpX
MSYVGIHSQISRNNRMSVLLLLAFPLLILAAVYAFFFFLAYNPEYGTDIHVINEFFVGTVPFILIIVGIWFLIAFAFHNRMINGAAGSKPLSRKENMRVYNLVENLCMSVGMTMPQVRIIEDRGLNAFASGLNEKTYTVTLTRGLINTLTDGELEAVIAHELMHIRNKDVRLLVVTIIFVGIFSFVVQVLFRNLLWTGGGRNKKDQGKGIIIALIIAAIAYFISLVFKFALSRKREYMADAGAADMTKKPWELASALRKISGRSELESVHNEEVKEMFIEHTKDKSAGFMGAISGLFATHPPIEKRIKVLENF